MKFSFLIATALLSSTIAAADMNAVRSLRCQVTTQGVLEQLDVLTDTSQAHYVYDGLSLESATVAQDSSGKVSISWKIGVESHTLSIASDGKSAQESLTENGEVQSTINYTSCQQ